MDAELILFQKKLHTAVADVCKFVIGEVAFQFKTARNEKNDS